jgi:hypothetical protein
MSRKFFGISVAATGERASSKASVALIMMGWTPVRATWFAEHR